ncbi:hypothetical protein EON67_08255, partial [archaeon]
MHARAMRAALRCRSRSSSSSSSSSSTLDARCTCTCKYARLCMREKHATAAMSASDSEHGGQRTLGRISPPAPSARRLPPSPVVCAQRVAAEHKQVRSLAYGAPLLELPADTQPDDAIDLTGDEDWSTQRTYSLPPLPHTSQSRSAPP